MPIPELEELKERVQRMRDQLETVTDDEWRAYVKVRDILAFDPRFRSGDPFPGVVRCAMMGIFENSEGQGTLGEYDAGAVQRFANLGE
jgi:hypothetical protein